MSLVPVHAPLTRETPSLGRDHRCPRRRPPLRVSRTVRPGPGSPGFMQVSPLPFLISAWPGFKGLWVGVPGLPEPTWATVRGTTALTWAGPLPLGPREAASPRFAHKDCGPGTLDTVSSATSSLCLPRTDGPHTASVAVVNSWAARCDKRAPRTLARLSGEGAASPPFARSPSLPRARSEMPQPQPSPRAARLPGRSRGPCGGPALPPRGMPLPEERGSCSRHPRRHHPVHSLADRGSRAGGPAEAPEGL